MSPARDLLADPGASLLLTDLYQLNMLQAYRDAGMSATAVFEFFVRKLPPSRDFLVAAGLEQVLDFLKRARFAAAELEWLAKGGRFGRALLDDLAAGASPATSTPCPRARCSSRMSRSCASTAPLPEAQLVETRMINLLHFQTLVASKAARMVLAAPGKRLVDFGLRRAHGAEAGLLAARASLSRRLRRNRDRARRGRLRRAGLRHDGPFLHPGARRRDGGVRALRALPSRQCRSC